MYIITRYDDVVLILSDPKVFSSSKGNLIVENARRFGNTLGASDNPTHDILKNFVKEAYSKHNLSRIANIYREKIREQLQGKKLINLSDVVFDTTAWAIAEMLNFPVPKQTVHSVIIDMQRYAPHCVRYNSKPEVFDRLFEIIKHSLTNKNFDTGPGIYKEFIKKNVPPQWFSLFTGPTISGASSLSGAVQFLILDLYRENKYNEVLQNRSLIPNAVNESLRFNASTGRFSRTVTTDITIHGVNLKPGDRVAVCLESANRDYRKFENPDYFNLNRNSTGMEFGHGLHSCIALYISKKLLAVFLEEFMNIVGSFHVLTRDKDLKYIITASGNDDMISNIKIEKL